MFKIFCLCLKYFNVEDMEGEVKNINIKKATSKVDTKVKILKWNSNITVPVLIEFFNQKIKNLTFSNELKNADRSPLYKKRDRRDKLN